MRIVKPQRLGLLTRTFERQRRAYLCVSAFAYVPLDATSVLLPEIAMWKFLPTVLSTPVLDMGMPKARGELVLDTVCFPPGNKPAQACLVSASLGTIQRQLLVVGDRHWTQNSVSTPVPFSSMPIDWKHAFGGDDEPSNPLGIGWNKDRSTALLRRLPNIEDPKSPLRQPNDRPRPVCFSSQDMSWPQRMQHVGTYDTQWLERDFPGLAHDTNAALFHVAQPEQWSQDFFSGDESFEFVHLHPDIPVMKGALSGLRVRVFAVTTQPNGEESLLEVQTRLDTVHAFPHVNRAVLVFRAVLEVREDDARDVSQLLLAAEAKDHSRDRTHYQGILQARKDPKQRALLGMDDRPLLAGIAPMAGIQEPADPLEAATRTEQLRARNLQRRVAESREKTGKALKQLEVEPEAHLSPVPEVPTAPLDALDPDALGRELETVRSRIAQAAAQQQQALEKVKVALQQQGLNPDKVLEDASRNGGGPPKFRAEAQRAQLESVRERLVSLGLPTTNVDAALADPRLNERLQRVERTLFDVYRKQAHHFPAASALEPNLAESLRAVFLRDVAAGVSLAGRDFTGANLEGVVCKGVDLQNAFLENVNLRNADLSGANLTNTVLARADLTGANLQGVRAQGVNLGRAVLEDARMEDAQLERAQLWGARLVRTRLDRAVLRRADLSGVEFEKTVFVDADLASVTFLRVNVSSVEWTGARLDHCNFLEVNLDGIQASRVRMDGAVLVHCSVRGANLREANWTNVRCVENCVFDETDFERARLENAYLRGSSLRKCSFAHAILDRADLSETQLMESNFYRASAKRARLERADLRDGQMVSTHLMDASLERANVDGLNLQGANLFRTNLARVRGAVRDLTRAFLKGARVYPRYEERPKPKGLGEG